MKNHSLQYGEVELSSYKCVECGLPADLSICNVVPGKYNPDQEHIKDTWKLNYTQCFTDAAVRKVIKELPEYHLEYKCKCKSMMFTRNEAVVTHPKMNKWVIT